MDYNRAKNVVVIGWVLVLIALVLNVLSWTVMHEGVMGFEIFGIGACVIAFCAAYAHDSLLIVNRLANADEWMGPVDKIKRKYGINILLVCHVLAIVATVLGFVAWFISVSTF